MKRELAALESPVLESIRRKTRFGNSNGGTKSLVYKRVKRSLSTVAVTVADGVVVSGEREGDELRSKVVVESNDSIVVEVSKEEGKIGSLNVDEKMENKDVGVDEECNGVEKGVCDGVLLMDVVEKGEEKVEGRVSVEKGVCDEGVGVNGEVPVMVVEEKGDNGKEKVEERVRAEGDVAMENVVNEDVEKEKVQEETLSETPLRVVKGRGKKFIGESYQRRFTRSTLKCNAVEDKVSEKTTENGDVEVKESTEKEGKRRVTRSKMGKPKEDGPDSCVTETSDSVVEDKENEDGESDLDKNVEETETVSGTPARSETRMSKQIVATKIPRSVRELFETGLLEGCPVHYDGGKGPGLRGRIRAIGICCPCNCCRGSKVIPPSMFEVHATNTYKRAVQYIFVENGRSLIQILKTCKTTRLETVNETVENAIGPLPERKVAVCQNCKESFLTMDIECSDPVCSPCIMSNLSPVGPVYSCRKFLGSSKFGTPPGASSYGTLQDSSLENSVLKNTSQSKSAIKQAKTFRTPKIHSSSKTIRTSESKSSKKSAKDSEEASLVTKACSSPMTGKSLATKRDEKIMKKPSKSSKLSRVEKTLKIDDRLKTTKRPRKENLNPKPSKTPSFCGSSEKKTSGKITRKDIRLHKLVFEDDVLPDGTELGYYARGKKMLDGFKKGSGIFCNCCETVVSFWFLTRKHVFSFSVVLKFYPSIIQISASQFESHAGYAARRKPYCYIYTSNGVSLHELSVNLIKGRKHCSKFNDDLCSICADGGNLLLCDGCPRAFHTECASLSSIPRGKWYCKYCENMFEREKFVAHNANAFAAGRVSGVDPMEQITKRSIRIVNNVGSDVTSCILCRGFDFSKSGFGPRTIILCDQCEKEYHVGCLKDHDMADLTELPDGKWFCNLACGRIDSALQNLLEKGPEKLPDSLMDIITNKNLQNVSESVADVNISWRLLSGKIASPGTRPLLSQAVAIFHESFAPIVEVVSGHDLIPAMVYGRNVGGQEYGGMYCAALTVNSVVVSAAIFRVFGPEVAEIPLVATSSGNHGKGYFQALFACIESLLTTLKVKTFVLPAAEEAESIWIKRFGFKKMTPDQLCHLKSNFWSIVRFEGTSMLQKPVPKLSCCPKSK